MLSAPFQLLHSGVRAVETITASVILVSPKSISHRKDAKNAKKNRRNSRQKTCNVRERLLSRVSAIEVSNDMNGFSFCPRFLCVLCVFAVKVLV
jgi:hypothetical protein